MATAVGEVADIVEAVGEETLEVAESVRRITGRDMGLTFFGSCVGTIGGLVIGAWWMKQKMLGEIEDRVQAETSELRNYYRQKVAALEEREEKKPLSEVVEDLEYAPKEAGHIAYHKVGSEPDKPKPDVTIAFDEDPQSVQNVFTNPAAKVETPDWDYATEVKGRMDKDIFIIHRDEYMENAWDFDSITLTYFEGDDVLSNERDEVIPDQDGTVGLENLSKFGHGSNDPNIVYVCNKEKAVVIEVVHSDGRYATEVHGFTEDDLQHSAVRRRPPRRSRYDDSD